MQAKRELEHKIERLQKRIAERAVTEESTGQVERSSSPAPTTQARRHSPTGRDRIPKPSAPTENLKPSKTWWKPW